MKKTVFMILTVLILFSSILTPGVEAAIKKSQEVEEPNSMLIEVKKYVKFDKKEGTIHFKKNIPAKVYEKYQLEELQKHFDFINDQVRNGRLIVDKDLNITETGFSLMAVYGKWTYHWWGYDRNFTNSQAIAYRNELLTIAAGAGMVTGVGAWFPPIGGLAAVSGGYWVLLATRVDANNNGNGVYVAVTWVNIFNVRPL